MKKLFIVISIFFFLSIPFLSAQSKPNYEIIYQADDGIGFWCIEIYLKDFRYDVGKEIAKQLVAQKIIKKPGALKFEFWEKKFSKSAFKRYIDTWTDPGSSRSFQINYYQKMKSGIPKWVYLPIQD